MYRIVGASVRVVCSGVQSAIPVSCCISVPVFDIGLGRSGSECTRTRVLPHPLFEKKRLVLRIRDIPLLVAHGVVSWQSQAMLGGNPFVRLLGTHWWADPRARSGLSRTSVVAQPRIQRHFPTRRQATSTSVCATSTEKSAARLCGIGRLCWRTAPTCWT